MRRFAGRLRRVIRDTLRPSRPLRSYAQQGEDLVLAHLLETDHVLSPFYIDIGSNDPVNLSNTYFFYRRGSRGVCVEPNPQYNRRYRWHRPADALLNVGITAGASGTLPYYEMDWPEFNTFDKRQAEATAAHYGTRNTIRRVIELPLMNINEFCERHASRPIDIMSLDVEGLDLGILQALDFTRWLPRYVCVEHTDHCDTGMSQSFGSIRRFLESHGYTLKAHNTINGIYRRQDLH